MSEHTTSASPATQKPSKDDVQGAMLEPSIFNKQWVRAGAILTAVAAVAASTPHLSATAATFLHLTSYAIVLGATLWNTFFAGIIMFKTVPRQTFGRIQSKLFPVYFMLTSGAGALMLGSLMLAGKSSLASTTTISLLGASLASSLINWLFLEPVATKLMFARYDIENKEEKTEVDKAQIAVLYKKFGKVHGISSLLNLVGFVIVVAHGWRLAGSLVL